MTARSEPDLDVGQRVRYARERAGMSRPVLGGLVGRSADWVKAVETGRLRTPKLAMLLKIAWALEISDLSQLTGNGHGVSVDMFAGASHPALPEVQTALTEYPLGPTEQPQSLDHLEVRLAQAWQVRHSSPDHRTRLGQLLPALIRDARNTARTASDDRRRRARRLLSGVYQLADFYVAHLPAPELVWLVADRAVTEGQEADDPYVTAGGVWTMVQVLRETGRWDEALHLAHGAIALLAPHLDTAPPDWHGITGALEAEIAYLHARRGRHGEAWAHWERAEHIVHTLEPGYRHLQSSFSRTVLGAHAVTLHVELGRPGEALRAADRVNAQDIPSLPRRSRHLIEVARAHRQRDERHAAWALLHRSERTAPETIRYNGFARDMLLDLNRRPPTGLADDVRDLSHRVGVAG